MEVMPFDKNLVHVEVFDKDNGFDLLEKEWIRLVDESPCSIFQSFEWISIWWKYFGKDRVPFILTIRYDTVLIGIVPMYKEKIEFLGIPIATRLLFMGRPLSDYIDVIAKRGYEEVVVKVFAEHLNSVQNEWDVLDFEEIPEGSNTLELTRHYFKAKKMTVYSLAGPPCPIVALPDSFDAFLNSLGPNTRTGYRRKLRRMNEAFPVCQKILRYSHDDIRHGVEQFVEIHNRRWKGLGFPSAFDDANHREFHISVSEKFAARDWLRLFVLSVNETDIAASLEFNFKNRIYMYQSNASASEEIMRYSPGLLIKLFAIEQGISEGMTVYDLLRGDESYKFDNLKAVTTCNSMLRIVSNSKAARFRFVSFLTVELMSKARGRILLETHEFKRHRITKKTSFIHTAVYLSKRLVLLFSLGTKFIIEHATSKRK